MRALGVGLVGRHTVLQTTEKKTIFLLSASTVWTSSNLYTFDCFCVFVGFPTLFCFEQTLTPDKFLWAAFQGHIWLGLLQLSTMSHCQDGSVPWTVVDAWTGNALTAELTASKPL